jgi:hypothetical protein
LPAVPPAAPYNALPVGALPGWVVPPAAGARSPASTPAAGDTPEPTASAVPAGLGPPAVTSAVMRAAAPPAPGSAAGSGPPS